MAVIRLYVEKKAPYAVEARGLLHELRKILGISGITGVRIVNRYDVEGLEGEMLAQCKPVVFMEPPLDELYDELEEFDDAFDDDDEDDELDEDDFLEVVCPSCGETIYFDESMLDSEDGLICPSCNEPIDIEVCCCDECDCGCCDGDEDGKEKDKD